MAKSDDHVTVWRVPSCCALATIIGVVEDRFPGRLGRTLGVYWTYPAPWYLCVAGSRDGDVIRAAIGRAVEESGGEVVGVTADDLAPWSSSAVAQTSVVQAEPAVLRKILEPWRLLEIRDRG